MKKFLLLAATAMIAMAADANVKFDVKTMAPKEVKSMSSVSDMLYSGKSMQKSPKKAATTETISFVEVSYDWLKDEDGTSYNVCNSVDITKIGGNVKYNGEEFGLVTIEGLCQGYATVSGYMNDEKIVIPKNDYCYEYEGYGKMYLDVALIVDDELVYKEGDIVFVKNKYGLWSLEEENAYGMVIRMTGDYAEYVWNYSPRCNLAQANGIEFGYYSLGEWTEYQNPIYVEQSEEGDEIHIFNFYGAYNGAHLVMYPNPEDEENPNSVLIPTWQIMAATNSNSHDQETYGYNFHILACDIVDESIKVNVEAEYINAEFVDICDENGEILIPQDKCISYVEDQYSAIFTNFDEEGRGYYLGRQTAITFVLTDGSSFIAKSGESSIQNVTSEKKDVKYFNLMGQQVDKNYKGLVISNGVKAIQK